MVMMKMTISCSKECQESDSTTSKGIQPALVGWFNSSCSSRTETSQRLILVIISALCLVKWLLLCLRVHVLKCFLKMFWKPNHWKQVRLGLRQWGARTPEGLHALPPSLSEGKCHLCGALQQRKQQSVFTVNIKISLLILKIWSKPEANFVNVVINASITLPQLRSMQFQSNLLCDPSQASWWEDENNHEVLWADAFKA